MPSETRARAAAGRIVEELMIPDPENLDVCAIAYLRGVLVEESRLEGAQGRLVIRGDRAKVRVNSSIPEEGKKRFVVAHEIGHFELHRQETNLFTCKDEYFDLWRNQNPAAEREANLFASELLMPKRMFTEAASGMEPDLDSVKLLTQRFGTSLTATGLRFLDCTVEPCAIVCSQNGLVQWWKGTNAFGRRISCGQRLSENTYALDFFKGGSLPAERQEVLANAWFPDSRLRQGATIQEHSLGMPNYGSVLTFLWIRDLIEHEEDEDVDERFTPDGKRYRW
jgi:Zn-dependent peptidase ImmA (M78 family)